MESSSTCCRHQSDLSIVDTPAPFLRTYFKSINTSPPGWEIPAWVHQVVPLPDNWEDVIARCSRDIRRNLLRKIRKYNLWAEVVDGEDCSDYFYDEVFMPYTTAKHSDEFVSNTRDQIIDVIDRSQVLFVKRDDEVVAGGVVMKWRKRLLALWAGSPFPPGAPQIDGALGALNYYTMRYGFQSGCEEVDLGGSRPVLTDGSMANKRRWGGSLVDRQAPWQSIYLHVSKETDAVRSFFLHNPMVVKVNDDLKANIFTDETNWHTQTYETLLKRRWQDGLSTIDVYALNGVTAKPKISPKEHQRLRIHESVGSLNPHDRD